jgi:hypothetical protein
MTQKQFSPTDAACIVTRICDSLFVGTEAPIHTKHYFETKPKAKWENAQPWVTILVEKDGLKRGDEQFVYLVFPNSNLAWLPVDVLFQGFPAIDGVKEPQSATDECAHCLSDTDDEAEIGYRVAQYLHARLNQFPKENLYRNERSIVNFVNSLLKQHEVSLQRGSDIAEVRADTSSWKNLSVKYPELVAMVVITSKIESSTRTVISRVLCEA